MITVLSCGYGRLHLMQSAEWLNRCGIPVWLVCGWVPKRHDGILVRIASRLAGRDLSFGMKKRQLKLDDKSCLIPCSFSDFLFQGMCFFDNHLFSGWFHEWIRLVTWKLLGFHISRIVKKCVNGHKDIIVLHLRSGTGHGGAIKTAKRLGVHVVVDHSIAHPAFMDSQLADEYAKNGKRLDIGIKSPFWRMVAEDCEWADMVLVNSDFVKKTFVERGYPSDKISVIYLGVRRDFIGLRKSSENFDPKSPIRLLFTGGFGFRKGGEYILEALRILKGLAKCNFEMDVVGSYEEGVCLIEKYRACELPIKFHGPVPQDDLKQYLASADIYLFPSLAEGCASSGMEAMAAGLCVVATEESGLPIEDGKTGCVVPSKNAKAIAETILGLMNNRAEINRLGKNAMELIKDNYSWEKYAENVVALYKRMIK